MKKILILAVALIFVFSGIALAGVQSSKHDMTQATGTNGAISDGTTSGTTDQVCVFCHHPHKTGDSSTAATLLWNRNNLTQTKGYTTYNAAVMTGDALETDADAKHTRVCLSCHDSTVALSVVDISPSAFTATAYAPATIGAVYDIGGDTNDLQNDHPVDFSYTYVQGVNSEFPATTGGDVVAGSNTWKLYNGTMQCGTCHEPHTDTASAGIQFIRNATTANSPLSGSTMCSDCHTLH